MAQFKDYDEFKQALDETVKTQGNQGAAALANLVDGLARTFWDVPDEEDGGEGRDTGK